MSLGEGFSFTRWLHNPIGAVTAANTGNMRNFLLCERKRCGIKNFWKVKDKAIQQLLQNNLASQIPAYTGAFAQLVFFNFSMKLKIKECKGKNPI